MNCVKSGSILLLKASLIIFYTLLVAILSCAPGPVQADKAYPIVLTLDDKTNIKVTFSGKPIAAYCAFPDSVAFEDIAWHLGSGKMLRPVNTSSKMKAFQVQLFWDIMPQRKDSLGRYYDSIYISLGGETNRSNSACVFVTNIPPVIDSIKISRRTYIGQDTLRDTVRPYDTLPAVFIRVFAHDVNQNALANIWSGRGSSRITEIANSITANYLLPRAQITDTLELSVYDRQGGNCDKVLFITSLLYKNRPPLIDSVKVQDSVFAGSTTVFQYSAVRFDSLHFKVWARDSDAYDNMQIKWTGKNPKQAVLRQKGTDVTWACTSVVCRDTVQTSGARVMDTVTVTVRDSDSLGVTRSFIIVKGRVVTNSSPLFDSLLLNDSLVKGAWTLVRWSASCNDTLRMRMFAHDPDSLDTARFAIKAGDSARLAKISDTAVLYICDDTLGRDTLSFLLSDKRTGAVLKQVFINVNNRLPVIDSMECGDSVFHAGPLFFSYPLTGQDSLSIRIRTHDPDSGDVLKDTIYSSSGTLVKRLSSLNYQFVCQDSTYSDTLIAVVRDARMKISSMNIVINIKKK
jgi:hypothetical protein